MTRPIRRRRTERAADGGLHQTDSVRILKRNLVLFLSITILWLAIDLITKSMANDHVIGERFAGPFLGLIDFTLVHNTGGAWGALAGNPIALGILSIIVCMIAVAYLFIIAPGSSVAVACAVSLVVAGGVGNAIDRFTLGYVVDFIKPLFMDFPVFNVADIGVTCGFILFFIALFTEMRREMAADSPRGRRENR